MTFSQTSSSVTLKPIHQPSGTTPSGMPIAAIFSIEGEAVREEADEEPEN